MKYVKQIILIVVILLLLLNGCSSIKVDDEKIKLQKCYDDQCDLLTLELEGKNFTIPYPLDFCFYEARIHCINDMSVNLDISFCDNLTSKYLCYEDLAVIERDKEICEKVYKEPFDEIYKENCKGYYDMALRVIKSNNSYCESKTDYSSTMYCYPKLIKKFKDVKECDQYRDILKSETFGLQEFKDFTFNNCYFWYAAIHNDSSACDIIEDEEYRKYCLDQASMLKSTKNPGCISYQSVSDICFEY